MLLDTSAWIELFNGTKNAKRVEKVLVSEKCYTCITSIAEIVNWAGREGKDSEILIDGVIKHSTIIAIDRSIAALAGKLNFERKKISSKWGMLDSFILASGTIYGLTILTKDNDFRGIPNIEIL